MVHNAPHSDSGLSLKATTTHANAKMNSARFSSQCFEVFTNQFIEKPGTAIDNCFLPMGQKPSRRVGLCH